LVPFSVYLSNSLISVRISIISSDCGGFIIDEGCLDGLTVDDNSWGGSFGYNFLMQILASTDHG
jgi:hypothetical protein